MTSLLYALPQSSRSSALTKCSACLFSTTSDLLAKQPGRKKKKKKVHRYIEPYRAAQARQRKAANIVRQQVLQKERKEAMGDPIRSKPTPFISTLSSKQPSSSVTQNNLNFFLKPTDLQDSLKHSKWLTEPLAPADSAIPVDPQREQQRKDRHEAAHANAQSALATITALETGSSKDRTRVNIQRCIEEFGRHNTDSYLPPKPASIQSTQPTSPFTSSVATESQPQPSLEIPPRVGRDTGSPEVQAAILTTKINVMADNLHKKDKHNLRNLRLLVHKRQKMLSYLRRKERGGPRWRNLVEKLGISDAMWKGEITLGSYPI